eukprot:TRINITY_DN18969_c0_g1_i6.p1 TRINITY_DN18969_c0_g1~~TRINITY_DN18969_c0_g1_i6.p1  ORF type:complete len:756 (-),score=152.50 TRINITY_DN18969_c0_g1_i6:372-2639(-)
MALLLALLATLAAAKIAPTSVPNMNGEYMLADTPGSHASANWSTSFKDYPGGVEFFEVYAGPITSTYSQVFWTALPEIHLPDNLKARFKGKGMAVVGFEADQVRRTPSGDVSVPINVAYNHHYGAVLLGEGSSMQRVPRDPANPRTLGLSPDPGWKRIPVEHTASANNLPTSMVFGYSNGGEFRKTYHGLAPPFAQVVDSPATIDVTPMQIDTWNRAAMNLTGGRFVPGPAPKHSLAPITGPDAVYSGLLECPLTSRIRKQISGGGWNDSYAAELYECTKPQRCPHPVQTAERCFATGSQLGLTVPVNTIQGSSAVLPAGCVVTTNSTSAQIFFNSNNQSTACCGAGVTEIQGTANNSLIQLSVSLSSEKNTTLISLSGPAAVWFGIGFGTQFMSNSPYAIIVDGDTGLVHERILGDHAPGVLLKGSIQVVSNHVSAGLRTVTLSRPLQGLTPQHHSFDPKQITLEYIAAVGSTAAFGYHESKTAGTVGLWPSSPLSAACICAVPASPFGQGQGTLKYLPTGEVIGFPPRCEPEPRESVLESRNPTCDIRTYMGGLSTCHHGWHLLDAEQALPWPEEELEYYLKYRLYFQEYDPSTHVVAYDMTWGIGGATGEYDVPQCPPGTPVEQCLHEITGTIVPPGDDLHFVGAHYHCHAPTCVAIEIWNNATGELLCREQPYHGQGADLAGKDRFDEQGYIAQRVCLWGNPPFESPPLVSGVPLYIRAVTNSTYGHHGEMALAQMIVANFKSLKGQPKGV